MRLKQAGPIIGLLVIIAFMFAAARIEGTLRLDLLP